MMASARVMNLAARIATAVLVVEGAAVGLMDLERGGQFLAQTTGSSVGLGMFVLGVVYSCELVLIVLSCLPALHEDRKARGPLGLALALFSGTEAAIASSAGDRYTAARTALVALVFAKQAFLAFSSRHLRVLTGYVDSNNRADTVTTGLRELATRYRARANTSVAIVLVVIYAACTSESPFARSPLARELGRAQIGCALALVAVLASLGAEDTSAGRFGRKKSL